MPRGDYILIDDEFVQKPDSRGPDAEIPAGWESLSQGKTVGKVVNIRVPSSGAAVIGQNILEVSGDVRDSLNLSVMIAAPKLMNDPGAAVNVDSIGGPFQDNVEIMQTFNIQPTYWGAGGNGPLMNDCKAEIQWGTGGISHKAVIDAVNGSGVNVSASFVRVVGLINNRGLGQSFVYQLGAHISPGHSMKAAQYTESLGDWDAGDETTVFAIPRFARSVNLMGMNNSSTPGPIFVGSIRFWGNPNGPALGTLRMGEYTFAGNAPNEAQIPIPSGAFFYSVVSQLASPNNIFAVFDLAI